ncbi:conserved hypothetical protein [Tenacibaculum sediminilitoris]|uniref:YciI family protein n=1 Tax=Tenacibaculum sediminilitoris TaxID=1820334 RepID=UPI00389630A8
MFIINFNFVKPIEEVNNYTELHREYVSKQYKNGIFILGGPKDPRNGGIVIANSNSEKELCEILDNDPLIIEKVAEYSLTKFTPLLSITNLKFLLGESK